MVDLDGIAEARVRSSREEKFEKIDISTVCSFETFNRGESTQLDSQYSPYKLFYRARLASCHGRKESLR